MKYWFLVALLLPVLYPFYVVHRQSLGHHRPVTRTPAEWGADYTPLSYTTEDGLRLYGWWVPSRRTSDRAVLLLHGKGGDRNGEQTRIFELGRSYWRRGYSVMMVDMRAHGESEGERVYFGDKESGDLLGWLARLKGAKGLRWIVHGFSMGAVTALMMRQKAPDRIAAVVADAPWIDFGYLVRRELWRRAGLPSWSYGYVRRIAETFFGLDFSAVDNRRRAAALCDAPVLYIFEKDDRLLTQVQPRTLLRICPKAAIRFFEGGHVEAYAKDPRRYESALFVWLEEVLNGSSR